ncbi:hypothetical protein LACDD01_01439 [Lactococcus sp. DD01]|nr:hypothetical protein LACDD01_01439 [Lactococcus sp. DD01]
MKHKPVNTAAFLKLIIISSLLFLYLHIFYFNKNLNSIKAFCEKILTNMVKNH